MRGAPPAPCTPGAHLLLGCLSPDCGHLSRTSASRLLGSNSSSWGMDNKRFPLGQAACTPQSCVFVSCLYRRFCKHSPHCLSRLPIPKCSLSHLKSHITLESLIFKDLFKVLHNQTGIVTPTTSPSHHFPLPWQGKRTASSQNWYTTLATNSLLTCMSLWINSLGTSCTSRCLSV